jgi:hypothetical protein
LVTASMVHGWLVNPYVEDVGGNAIFVAILALSGYGFFYVTRRRQIHSFFGLSNDKRVTVYTSRLDVPPLATSGVDGRKRSFGGIAVPEYETRLVALIQQFFYSVMPNSVQRPGHLRFVRWTDVGVAVQAAPATKRGLETFGAILTLGSSAYNSVSLSAEEDMVPFAKMAPEGNAITITADGEETQIDLDPVSARTCFLQRLIHPKTGQFVFYAAGFSAGGTECALRYLLTQWRLLAKRFPDATPFCVLLSYPEENPTEYTEIESFPRDFIEPSGRQPSQRRQRRLGNRRPRKGGHTGPA